MGTSTSSKGGGAGSPFDPAWLNAGDSAAEGGSGAGESSSLDPAADETEVSTGEGGAEVAPPSEDADAKSHVAPDRRFASARTHMSAYLSGGGRESLRAAARNMVNRGMGGATRAASTMRGTARGAGQVAQFLVAARDRTDPAVADWVERVRAAGLSADDLVLEVVREVLPNTGSVDDESLRNAAAEALGTLYETDPDVDIFNLSDQQISDVIGFILANDICNRIDLQLGQSYERLKFDARQVQENRNDIKEFVHAEVRVVMSRVGARRRDPQALAREVLASALEVFGE